MGVGRKGILTASGLAPSAKDLLPLGLEEGAPLVVGHIENPCHDDHLSTPFSGIGRAHSRILWPLWIPGAPSTRQRRWAPRNRRPSWTTPTIGSTFWPGGT